MTAKEMFMNLGYKEVDNNYCQIVYKRNNLCILFNKEDNIYGIAFNAYDGSCIVETSIGTHKAIHQQMKELGWL